MTEPVTLADLQARLAQRPETPENFICEAVALAAADSLADGRMTEHLRKLGWVLVHVGDGTCPAAPVEWLQQGIDVASPGWIDPVGHLEELWRQAWAAGFRVGTAGREATDAQ